MISKKSGYSKSAYSSGSSGSSGFAGSGAGSIPLTPCAIYTRKSSEEGLEQGFNSLHAQREACEAYILSQKSLGWSLNPEMYDDGGFSGGNVERPALRQLIQDIEAGKVKVIVVYKVDRLTRSLADFAKLVELFDAKGVSFVSVTQQFNTTTSMGRLTLNVLLSFAQFEREVTSERIRDKIAASKRKGMWMGGVPPIGYLSKGRTLEPDEPRAEQVRSIYRMYLKLNCVRMLRDALVEKGWRTPVRQNKRVGFGGDKPFSRGHLYRILGNPVYRGMMVHKDEVHPGQHPAIVDEVLWNEVQERLATNRNGHKTQSHAANPSLLIGKLFDDTGRRLISSHARKGNKRYRYYVTPVDEPGEPLRLPAGEIEQAVITAMVNWAENDQEVVDAVGWGDAKVAGNAITSAKYLAAVLRKYPKDHLDRCLHSVHVGLTAIRIAVDLVGCGILGGPGSVPAGQPLPPPTQPLLLEVAAERRRCGMAVRLIIGGQSAGAPGPNANLIDLLAKARDWLRRLTEEGEGLGEIAKLEKVSPGYVARMVHLGLLAPDLAQAIAAGKHPPDLSAKRLMNAMPLPMDWDEQRAVLQL